MQKTSEILKVVMNCEKKNKSTIHIGIILRKKRMDRKMTLLEATKGICCLSYLSKIEHGTIEPKKYVMEELIKRIEIDPRSIKLADEYYSLMDDGISALYNNDFDGMQEIMNQITDDEEIHFADIIRAMYYLLKGEPKKVEQYLHKIYNVKDLIDTDEALYITIIGALHMFAVYDYQEAYNSIILLDNVKTLDPTIDKLRLRILIESKFMLGDYVTLGKYISQMKELCYLTCDNEALKTLVLTEILAAAYSNQKEEAIKMFNYARIGLTSAEEERCKIKLAMALNDCSFINPEYLLPLEKVWYYDEKNNNEQAIKALSDIDYNSLDGIASIYYIAMDKKHKDDEYFFISYLKHTMAEFAFEHGMYECLKYACTRIKRYYVSKGRLKDAMKAERYFENFKK